MRARSLSNHIIGRARASLSSVHRPLPLRLSRTDGEQTSLWDFISQTVNFDSGMAHRWHLPGKAEREKVKRTLIRVSKERKHIYGQTS